MLEFILKFSQVKNYWEKQGFESENEKWQGVFDHNGINQHTKYISNKLSWFNFG